jgi:hypothetical protein
VVPLCNILLNKAKKTNDSSLFTHIFIDVVLTGKAT